MMQQNFLHTEVKVEALFLLFVVLGGFKAPSFACVTASLIFYFFTPTQN
jgi:hypothetical protein